MLEAGAPGFPLAVFAAIGLFAVVNSALINMLMASRLLYGMANERILPRVFGRVHPTRRTPWVSIVFTSVIAHHPGDDGGHHAARRHHRAAAARRCSRSSTSRCWCCAATASSTTHFRAPCWTPYVGIVLCGFLATPLSGRPLQQFVVAGILLVVGAVLWVVNRLVVGKGRGGPDAA